MIWTYAEAVASYPCELVATIKHDAHDFEIDLPGKDTWRHRQAGSGTTVIASSSKVAMVRLTEREAELEELLRLVDRSYDLVLIEGMRRSPLLKILVHRQEPGADPPHILGEVWAVVSEEASDIKGGPPRFRPDALLRWLPVEWALVLPCDQPFLMPELLRELLAQPREGVDAVVGHPADLMEPAARPLPP